LLSKIALIEEELAVLAPLPTRGAGDTASIRTQHGRPADVRVIPGRRAKLAPPAQSASAEKVLQAFNTWAFKREQPDNPQLMLEIIAHAIQRAEPVPFVLYWGKGPRCRLDEPDTTCLDYLAALARRVEGVYPRGAAITLIFTDTHAELNGHSQQSAREYFAAVETGAHTRGFRNLPAERARTRGERHNGARVQR